MKTIKNSRRGFITSLLGLFGGVTVAKAGGLSAEQVVKAWEDSSFRDSLTDEQWNELPANPAGKSSYSEFEGNITGQISGNSCSGNGCSGNGCSGNGCSGNNCSGNGCSGNGCSGNGCSGNGCSGNSCSGATCSASPCSSSQCSVGSSCRV